LKAAYKKSFTKDLRNLQHHPAVLGDVRSVIEAVEAAESLRDVANCRKIKTAREDYYRIRIGDYRIGLCLDEDLVIFVRCLHRRDIYRYFP